MIIVTEAGAVERRFVPRDAASAALVAQAFGTMLSEWTGRPAPNGAASGVALASTDCAR